MKNRFLLTLFCCLLVLGSLKAGTQTDETERIISFHSDIHIERSGLLVITEKIKVYSAGDQIKRGIVRRIPLYRSDILNNRKKMDFEILGVSKDGQAENYSVEDDNGIRSIYIGNKNIIIANGIYEYTISYKSKGHVGFFRDYDELYWNVTGNDWSFPINKASATISLPDGASAGNTKCYTGVQGSKDSSCKVVAESEKNITFKTAGNLNPGEGFTIAVTFTSGIIQRPTFIETIFNDFRELAYTLILLAILAGYYFYSWSKYGKDPKTPIVIPSFKIPNDWSPAVLRQFYKKKTDEKSFAISVINMAVKKVIKITRKEDEDREYVIERASANTSLLSKEENVIYANLLKGRVRIPVNVTNGAAINSAKSAQASSLKLQIDLKDFFISYKRPLIRASILTAIVFILFMIFVETGTPLMALFFTPFITMGGFSILYAFKMFRESIAASIFLFVWGTGFGGVPLYMLVSNLNGIPTVSAIFILATAGMFILYICLIKAPTIAGAEILGKIEGFKLYLETAEEHRLNLINPPDHTPSLFEKFLPYAMALDVENAWGSKFEEILSKVDYMPDWYDGQKFPYNTFNTGFTKPFNTAVSDSKPPSRSSSSGSSSGSSGSSSWSSGSSSSGSSGGGGGGGGGGGW